MPHTLCFNSLRHFDYSVARHLAIAAEVAYADHRVVEETLINDLGYDTLCTWDVDATQCFLATNPEQIIVCFRGTEMSALEDWIVDLDFELVDGPLSGRVHAGFYDALSCVWQSLEAEISRHQEIRQRPLWVTGHSMGAGLASLAVARWLETNRTVSGLYTFGQPRCGDRDFAREFDFRFRAKTFRIVNHCDIVTRTPPRSLSYYHIGSFIYLDDEGGLSPDVGWWRQFLDGWQGGIESILDWGGGGVEDHRMTNYRRRLEQVIQSRLSVTTPAIRPRRRAAA